jgi:hypothetical protein
MMDFPSGGFLNRTIVVAAALGLCACAVAPQPQPEINITSAPAAPEPIAPPPPPAPPPPTDKAVVRDQDFSDAIRAFYGCMGRAANELDTDGADPKEAGMALIAACAEARAKSIAAWSKGRPTKVQAEYAKQRDPDDLEVATNLILNRRAKAGK